MCRKAAPAFISFTSYSYTHVVGHDYYMHIKISNIIAFTGSCMTAFHEGWGGTLKTSESRKWKYATSSQMLFRLHLNLMGRKMFYTDRDGMLVGYDIPLMIERVYTGVQHYQFISVFLHTHLLLIDRTCMKSLEFKLPKQQDGISS